MEEERAREGEVVNAYGGEVGWIGGGGSCGGRVLYNVYPTILLLNYFSDVTLHNLNNLQRVPT